MRVNWAIAVCLSFLFFAELVFAQERNPFDTQPTKPAPTQQQLDAEKQVRAKEVAEQLAREAILDKMDREQLRMELNEVKAKTAADIRQVANLLEQVKNDLVNTQFKLAESDRELKIRRTTSEVRDEFESALIIKLLTSEKTADQLTALNFMIEYHDRARSKEVYCVPMTSMLLVQLRALINSDHHEVRNKAVWFLMAVHPDLALEEGYQAKTGYWRPVNQTGRFHGIFANEINYFEYDSVSLAEVVEEISMNFDVQIILDSAVDQEIPISFEARDLRLRDGLDLMFEKHELTYRVIDDGIVVHRAGDPKAKNIATYCVRGLLADSMSVGDIVELVAEQLGENGKARKLDKHRITVIADAISQNQVSKILGALAK